MPEDAGATGLQVGNLVAFISVLVVNSLSGGTRIVGGRTTADVSAAYPTLLTPAGFTFSIWGVIYALLAAFVVFQLLPKHRHDRFNGRVGYLFILSCLFNVAWLFLWQYEYVVASVPMIFALLAALIMVYLRLGVGRGRAALGERVFVHLPVSVYLGWITVASIADVASALVSVGWAGSGIAPSTWAQIAVVVASGVALVVLVTRRDPAYGSVVAWALVGITANQMGHPEVAFATGASAALVASATIFVLFTGGRGTDRGRRVGASGDEDDLAAGRPALQSSVGFGRALQREPAGGAHLELA